MNTVALINHCSFEQPWTILEVLHIEEMRRGEVNRDPSMIIVDLMSYPKTS